MSVQIWTHLRAAAMQGEGYGLIDDAAIVVDSAHIAWVGRDRDVPREWRELSEFTHSGDGALATPGLIDCHTHLVYGGDRAHEFEMRLNGASYEDIARAGGGIASTVKATRAASEGELMAQSERRLRELIAEGVTTIEIKSGYGLSLEHERKCLRVARALGDKHSVEVHTTFLGAHALPPEFAGRADDYIDEVVNMMSALHREGLVDAVDAFCERIAFTPAQVEKVFSAAHSMGLRVKLHAEQLSDSGGAQLAARYGALSCDHLEWLGEEGAEAMARGGTVAVLLPGAFYFLRETRLPPVDLLRAKGVPIAISTDCNPGSSPCTSLLLMMNMACTLFKMTPLEALAGVTRNAARALGAADRGMIAPGQRANFVLWDAGDPAQLAYAMGANPCRQAIFEGKPR
ncbi:MAG TPA: imidazolonepropionase [Ramlibacter sp.]|nr:imidazolonepropionase [Ramlibacter sp.]